jgi:CubicO group peptidase (beta-lactamase class C family)
VSNGQEGERMSALGDLLRGYVEAGTLPGAVALVARGDRVEVEAVGSVDTDGSAPMARDTIFRIASITKPIVAAGLLTLLEDGRLALDEPVDAWLPELAKPVVVRTPASPVDDVVPADRSITVEDVLTYRTGYGFPSDFSLPQVQELFTVQKDGRHPRTFPPADEWIAALGRVPLLHQPGQAWLYDTSGVLQGILVSRVTGTPLPDFLTERIFEPLGMADTAFHVPAAKVHRFTSYYEPAPDGELRLVDPPDGQWSTPPALALGNGGLVSTIDDWYAFARMLLGHGTLAGHRILSPESVRAMTTNQLTAAQAAPGALFLEGQGWGYGGSVDTEPINPWNVPGRYGWTGGTGTTAHIVPATGSAALLFTQVGVTSPEPLGWQLDFWRHAVVTS